MKRKDGVRLVEGSRFYQISFVDPITGKQRRYTSKTTDRDDARRKRTEDMSACYRRKHFKESVQDTVAEILQWYLTRFLRGKERFDEYNYECNVRMPLSKLGAFKGCELKSDQILEYIENRRKEVANGTINRELSPFRAAFAKAVKTDAMLTANPFSGIPLLKETQRDRSASKEEERKLLEHSAGLMHDLIDWGFAEGFRAGQIRELEWTNIDFDRMRVRTSSYKGAKGERYEYWVPLFERGLAVLQRRPRLSKHVFCYEDGRPIPDDGLIHSSFPRLVERLQIHDFNFHDIRHTFATNDYKLHHDIYGLSLMLGHRNIKTTQIYINLSNEDLLEDRMQLRRAKSAVSSAAERLLDTQEAAGSNPAPRIPSKMLGSSIVTESEIESQS